MVMNIHKYDHTKGSKAFSYFSVVAKNYLILHNNNNYKRMKQHDGAQVTDHKRDPISEERSYDGRQVQFVYFWKCRKCGYSHNESGGWNEY